jgi:biotin carboxylase
MTPRSSDPRIAFEPTEDAHFAAAWDYLDAVLQSLHRPPVLDRRGHRPVPGREPPRPVVGDCLVFMEVAESHWSKVLAAPRVLPPGSLVWVLCPGWLERAGSRILCHRGIWADRGGQLYLDDFDPPREVSYFVNLYSAADTFGARCDGNDFEPGLACPASSTQEISAFVGCKFTTRLLAAERGVPVPRTLAFVRRSTLPIPMTPAQLDLAGCAAVHLPADMQEWSRERLLDRVRAELDAHVPRWPAHVRRLVVKPSGVLHMQCFGVSIHDRDDPDSVARAVVDLLMGTGPVRLLPDDSVLVDAFAGGQTWSVRTRVIIARVGESPGDVSVQSIVAGVGASYTPIGGLTSWPQSIADTLANYRVPNAAAEARKLEATFHAHAAATFTAIASREPWSAAKPGGRSDLLGLDFVFALPGDTLGDAPPLSPVLIEVNNHDCAWVAVSAAFTQIDHRTPGVDAPDGGVFDEYFRAIATRSQLHRLSGRTVLVIGGVTASKQTVWRAARERGVRVVLANDREAGVQDGIGSESVAQLLVPNLHADHSLAGDEASCAAIVAELARRQLAIDGVLTFWEDCTVVAALVAERLRMRGNPVAAQRKAKDKLETSRALAAALPFAIDAFEPLPATLLPPFVELRSAADIDGPAARSMQFPAVLRYRYGSSAVGTRVVRDHDEAVTEIRRLESLIRDPGAADALYGGCGFRFGEGASSLVLTGFADGSEHDVDLLLFDGELVDAWVTDNGETDLPLCAETCAVMPSRLSHSRQQQLISAAWQVCRRVGLENGAVNVELKLSSTGPKILEINGRMGGFYIPEWVRRVWGYDLPAACYQIACGIRPIGRVRRTPLVALAGVMVFPEDGAHPDKLTGADVVKVDLGHSPEVAEYPEPRASIAWSAATPDAAVARMAEGVAELYADRPARAETLRRYASRLPRDG